MKTRRLLIGMLTLAAIACTPEQQVVNPELNVDKSEVSVEAKDGKATVNVTSNVEWTASSQADWISIDPSSGEGSENAVAVKI
ncbi:MAG: BACON domain-containing protein, partial [Bacteroidales bacterium]|nr:BACON domain-containing protein [Bacteroidales bacterium]